MFISFDIQKNERTFAALKATTVIPGWSRSYLAYYESIINHIKKIPALTGKEAAITLQ